MSNYTPSEADMREAVDDYMWKGRAWRAEFVGSDGREFDRFVAKIKADALREFVAAAQDLLNCSGDTRWMARALTRADLIKEELK